MWRAPLASLCRGHSAACPRSAQKTVPGGDQRSIRVNSATITIYSSSLQVFCNVCSSNIPGNYCDSSPELPCRLVFYAIQTFPRGVATSFLLLSTKSPSHHRRGQARAAAAATGRPSGGALGLSRRTRCHGSSAAEGPGAGRMGEERCADRLRDVLGTEPVCAHAEGEYREAGCPCCTTTKITRS